MIESFYDKSVEQLERRFESSAGAGLSTDAARKARKKYGPNRIWAVPTDSFSRYRERIPADFASLLLLGAAGVAAVFEQPVASGIIALLLIVNYAAAVFTLVKAGQVLDGMAVYSLPTVKVLRDGRLRLSDMRALVPGDVIFLSAGDIVPADCRLLESSGLRINESPLTGIPRSSDKDAKFVRFGPGLPLADQQNMAFATTIVTGGTARAMVVATGENTAAVTLEKVGPIVTHEKLKILAVLKKCCSLLSLALLLLVFAVTVIHLWFGIGEGSLFGALLTGLCLAAAGMAELYLAFGTIIIGCGTFAAARRQRDVNVGALIKNSEKLEPLKELTTLIVPKDGMITQARAEAEKIYLPRSLYEAQDPDRVDKLSEIVTLGVVTTGIYGAGLASLNGTSRRITPEESALITLAEKLGLYHSDIEKKWRILEHTPAGGPSKFDTTLTLSDAGELIAHHRGSADAILDACINYREMGRTVPMSLEDKLAFSGIAESLTKSSYKVAAIAVGRTGYNNLQRIGAIQSDLTFIGFIAIREPLQPRVAQILSRCRAAGIRVIMTTDTVSETDKFLAMSIGLINGEKDILTEAKMQTMTKDLLRTNLPLYSMYCGIPAASLASIIDMMKADGEKVGLLAGGMNGALLLRHADVGFAQSVTISPKASRTGIDIRSRSTPAYSRIGGVSGGFDAEALKFISDVVVSDADEKGRGGFAAVVSALEYARTIYKNLLRMVRYLVTSQLTRIFLVLGGLFTAMTPLLPLPILISGLAVDFLAVLVCAFARPPRDALALADDAESSLVHPFLTNIRSVCFALSGAAGILLTRPLLDRLGLVLTDGQYASLAFTVLLLFQLINLLEYESEKSLFTGNLRLNVVFCGLLAAMAVFLLVCFLSPAAGALFGIERIPGLSWIAVAVLALIYLGLHEIFKLIAGRKK